jgi:hypothetical protein
MGQRTTYFSTGPAAYAPASFLRTAGASGLQVPPLAGARAVAFWLRATDNGQYGSYLADIRPAGSGYWWNRADAAGLRQAAIDGVDTASYAAVFAPGWHKVYLEFDTLDQGFYLLCRHSETEFFFPADLADITFYDRPFTAVERADAAGPLPTAGVLACYQAPTLDGTGVADSTGRGPALPIVGAYLVNASALAWVPGYAPARFVRTAGASGLRVPAIAGARAAAFWLRATDNGQYGSYLLDFRPAGGGYWWNRADAAGFRRRVVDGLSTPSYAAAFAPGWHKVYVEFDTLDQGFYLLCRYSETEFFFPADLADVTIYDRPLTAAELGSGPLPTTGVLACYQAPLPDGAGLADSTGRWPALATVGPPLAAGPA